jgi:hypothetical protein
MAFLGSLGKSLGLSSSFGEGLVEGLATSVDKGIQDDMKRTQDNVDNLVLETYKGAVEGKKEFDKMYKENKKLVENIAANMGGEQGINHPQALQAAQTLINLKGLDGAFTVAQDYNKAFRMYGKHPTKSLLADETGNGTPITLSALTKSTVTPMAIPDVSKLGESANVGFMKLDFFGGKDSSSSEITTRAQALIKARGIDINEQTVDLPPALKGKIDPLMLGIKENPIEEKARLVTMLANAERDGTLTPELEGNIKEMIDVTEGITRSMRKNKALDANAFNSAQGILYKNFHTLNQIEFKSEFGKYIGSNAKDEQLKLINSSVKYYMDIYAESALKGNLEDGQSYMQVIIEAMGKNKKLTSTNINGVYRLVVADGEGSDLLDAENKKKVNPKDKKNKMPGEKKNNVEVGELKSSQEYINELKKLKTTYPNLAQSRITGVEKNFVKSYMAENEGTSMSEAQKIFRQLTQG